MDSNFNGEKVEVDKEKPRGLVGSLVCSFKRILNTIAWIWLIIGGVIGSVVGGEVGAALVG